MGYAVTTVEEALKSLRNMPPDVAIVDGILPDGSSFSLIRAIRRASPGAFIIGMTATPTDGTSAQFKECGANTVVDKRDIPGMTHVLRAVREDHCPDDDDERNPVVAPTPGSNSNMPIA